LSVVIGLYGRGVWQLWQRAGIGQGIHYWQVAAFGGGLVVVLIAFVSPLAALAGALFSAHMLQHLLLMIVAPPLLILGAPLLPLLWALPLPARRAIGQEWKAATSIRYLWQQLTHPVTVWLLSVVTLWVWHLPALYQAALGQVWVHELEHFSFFGASLLFWWLVIQPHGRRRLGYGAGILFIFTTALQSGALGALLTFARVPLYPIYSSSVAGWNMTLLEDQQLAGLMMWIPSGIVYLVAALILLGAWLQSLERQEAARQPFPYQSLISPQEAGELNSEV
jgi:cytochrome c oxidase assembly factor CtaG